jgi:predicted phosphodiesterase
VEVIRQLADRFDVDAVLDTGDVTSFGHPFEGEFGHLLDDVGVPYYVVPGNHDSPAVRASLGAFENVFVIDGETVDIAGVRVLGVAHPVFTADNRTPREEVDEAVANQAMQTGAQVRRDRPDLLAVHDPAQAAGSLGSVDLVLAGHLHERTWTEEDGTVVLTVGSTGATGLGSFTVDTDLPFEASVLYFDDGALVAVDAVALDGTEGDFRIDRRLVRPTAADDGG